MTTGTDNGDFLFGDDTFDFIDGKGGNDAIFGNGAADLLLGGEGDDLLVGGRGEDTLNGGMGLDTASYANTSFRISADLATGNVEVSIGMLTEVDTLIDIENVTGSSSGDWIGGNAQDNVLRGLDGMDGLIGRGGNDKLYGGARFDALEGGEGADLLDGGEDGDMAIYSNSLSGVTVNLATGVGQGGEAEGDTLVSIEAVMGSVHGDKLTGDDLDNVLFGNDGSDTLKGGRGTTSLRAVPELTSCAVETEWTSSTTNPATPA